MPQLPTSCLAIPWRLWTTSTSLFLLIVAIGCDSSMGPDPRIAALKGTWLTISCQILEKGGSHREEPCGPPMLLAVDGNGHFENTRTPLPGEDPVVIPFNGRLAAGRGFLLAIVEPSGAQWFVTSVSDSQMKWSIDTEWRFSQGDPTPVPVTVDEVFGRQ